MIDILLQKILDLLTGYFTSIKNKLNYLYENIDNIAKDFFILDPDVLEDLGPITSNYHFSTPLPYLYSTNASFDHTVLPKIILINSEYYVFQRSDYGIATTYYSNLIEAGKYNKLICDVEVVPASGSYKHADIVLTSELTIDSVSRPTNIIKDFILCSADKTSEEINEQTGLVINSVTPTELTRQIIEIDISDINENFYFGFWNCDEIIRFVSIKLEK